MIFSLVHDSIGATSNNFSFLQVIVFKFFRQVRVVVVAELANCTVIAHNFQGYDSNFILQYLRKQGVKYDVNMCRAKVLGLTVDMFNIHFIDSLNFIRMKLANFPKTFGIEEFSKGYFPHLFNRKENENYIGPILPTPYYNPDNMNP